MIKRLQTLILIIYGLVSQALLADTESFPANVLGGIDAMKKLPVSGLHVVESQGRLLLVSTNGHYVVLGGRILDMWNQVEIQSVDDVQASLRIPLNRMGIRFTDLGGVALGNKNHKGKEVTVFLDPVSPESQKIIPHIKKLLKDYRFNIVFAPASATRGAASRFLICNEDVAKAFIQKGQPLPAIDNTDPCGKEKLQRNIVTVSLLGIKLLPFTITPNGISVAGIPDDYRAFIAANMERVE